MLKNKTIMITGATRGIGRAIALRTAEDGPRLALCGRDRKKLQETAEQAQRKGAEKIITEPFDLSDEAGCVSFCRTTSDQLGTPDILVNNAGYNFGKAPLWEVETTVFDAMIAVNLRAPFLLMRELFPGMKERRSGHIINILSTVCHFDNETMGVYTAAKKGLQGLADVFRKEARTYNIRVSSIYPGGTDTDFRPNERPDYMKPESAAEALYHIMTAPDDLIYHQVTFRPMVETNF